MKLFVKSSTLDQAPLERLCDDEFHNIFEYTNIKEDREANFNVSLVNKRLNKLASSDLYWKFILHHYPNQEEIKQLSSPLKSNLIETRKKKFLKYDTSRIQYLSAPPFLLFLLLIAFLFVMSIIFIPVAYFTFKDFVCYRKFISKQTIQLFNTSPLNGTCIYCNVSNNDHLNEKLDIVECNFTLSGDPLSYPCCMKEKNCIYDKYPLNMTSIRFEMQSYGIQKGKTMFNSTYFYDCLDKECQPSKYQDYSTYCLSQKKPGEFEIDTISLPILSFIMIGCTVVIVLIPFLSIIAHYCVLPFSKSLFFCLYWRSCFSEEIDKTHVKLDPRKRNGCSSFWLSLFLWHLNLANVYVRIVKEEQTSKEEI